MPNLLYLGKPEVINQDIFKIVEEEDNTGTTIIVKIANAAKPREINDITIIVKIANAVRSGHIKNSTATMKVAGSLFYSSSIDTSRYITDTEADQLQNQVLLDNSVDIMKKDSINTFVPENVLNLIETFSSTYEDTQKTVQTAHSVKKRAEELEQTAVVYEELESYGIDANKELYMILLKAYRKQKTEEVNDLQNLIFVYVKNWFVEKATAVKLVNEQRETFSELPTVSAENWLEQLIKSDHYKNDQF